ncbi:alpha-L-fucosidase [Flavobacterium sp. PL11]|uniref:alpha-L-fucosidase n=1 Tax=Flavobacterium sp. PL11 TaxID=3071717 RepID=UPI002E03A31F|nr:alpha-L-fucosidase [Flavobacterium sp. PL11]
MNKNFLYKIIVLSGILSVMSCKTNMQKETVKNNDTSNVSTTQISEENPYADANKPTSYQSNIEAYYKSNTPSKVDLPYETEEEYQTRMQWWKDAKYGMFIHWGLYSALGGEYNGKVTPKIAEWIQNTLKIPASEYKKLVEQFNPAKFNADQWVSVAKDAGMKYMVITSKHHDGFALFDSKVSEYDVMSTPFKRDIIKELKTACDKQGIKFGLYYSHAIDWDHPEAYIGEGVLRERMNTVDFDATKMDRAKYLKEKSFPQLREILTNYGTIDILWFDMGKGLDNEEIRQFVKIAKELQPNIIVSSRIGDEVAPTSINKDMYFDFFTPSDNYFTGDDLAIPFEMAGTTNTSWGYRKDDQEWRKPLFMLNSLIASASRNGNYLLNVGPMANGLMPEEPVKNLKIAGQWLKENAESVYSTTPSPFPWNYNWGYVTQKPNKIYLNVFNWPVSNEIELNGILSKVDKIHVLGSNKNVAFKQNGRFLTIDLAGVPKKEFATPLVVDYKDAVLKIDHTISQGVHNDIRLDRINSEYLKEESLSSWQFTVHTPGKFKINILSNEKGNHSKPEWTGSEQKGSVQVAGKIIPVTLKRDTEKVNPTLFFYNEIGSNVGEVEFLKKGTYTLQLKGFKIGADKWTEGLGLDRIELIKM